MITLKITKLGINNIAVADRKSKIFVKIFKKFGLKFLYLVLTHKVVAKRMDWLKNKILKYNAIYLHHKIVKRYLCDIFLINCPLCRYVLQEMTNFYKFIVFHKLGMGPKLCELSLTMKNFVYQIGKFLMLFSHTQNFSSYKIKF